MVPRDSHTESARSFLEVVQGERLRLLSVAYNLLGSASDAEDAVQEAYLRWYRQPPSERNAIKTPGAWLTKVVTRICLDQLRSARKRREVYVGEWLPEPIPAFDVRVAEPSGTTSADPADRISLDESVSMALLIVLDKMSPAERVSFVLHDVFQYSFAEIAEIVGRTPHACRQLASSARKRAKSATSGRVEQDEHRRVNQAFKEAWQQGSLTKLLNVLDPSVTTVTDGGGIVSAAIDPMVGAEQVAAFFKAVMIKQPDLIVSEAVVNYQPGLIGSSHGRVIAVVATQITGTRISNIWAVRNPEKLHLWHNELSEGEPHVLRIA